MGRVLVIGLDPARSRGWDPRPIQAAVVRGQARFAELGIESDLCLVAVDDDPEGAIVGALRAVEYACVVVGGGIRRDEGLLEFFEVVINLVHRYAPKAAVAFNRGPGDSADAAMRWLGSERFGGGEDGLDGEGVAG
ncbi:hypothetical protein [Actinokineospora cianjurensis]|uniref:Uncharacterized protein n=1 Tax=Actinokineospora cianjurensis TaxID=585224 RepID=A0A421B3D1_9PSEU|nr:hypothetical protein [Actinokineospora cianjurensis]RLK58835.1 hypothetical protein CLV68_3314 [Actinokineospora cianjurensis]